jgi:uncharacterized protein YbjQ (UPF0145 family)
MAQIATTAAALASAEAVTSKKREAGQLAPGEVDLLITTSCDLPGYEITEVLGLVFGLTVRSRHVGSQLAAELKSIVGGELRGMTKNLATGRSEALQRLVEAAQAKGGEAVVAFRFESSDLGELWTEICAYGTAVKMVRAR